MYAIRTKTGMAPKIYMSLDEAKKAVEERCACDFPRDFSIYFLTLRARPKPITIEWE